MKDLVDALEKLHKVERREIKECSDVVGRAFEGYPFLNALFGNPVVSPKKLGEYFRVIMLATFDDAIAFSLDDKLKELLFIFPPQKYDMKLSKALKCGGVKLFSWLTPKIVISSLKYDSTCMKCRTQHGADDAYYVYIFAVDPPYQGKGSGSKLMKPLVQWANETGNALYLETHKANNITMYEHYGFELVGTDIMHTGEPQYAMLMRPKHS